MLDAIIGMKIGYVLCGVIWATAMGCAVGNYACSLVHRLPRGRLTLLTGTGTCGKLTLALNLLAGATHAFAVGEAGFASDRT